MVNGWRGRVQQWLYPPICLLCGSAGADGLDLCAGCRADLPLITTPCLRCGEPLPRIGICGACLHRPPPFDRAVVPFRYQPPVDELIKGFKFHGRLNAGRVLRELLATTVAARLADPPDVIVPVPLHRRRLRERGFNQALEIARGLGRELGIRVDGRACRRRRPTRSQSELPHAERRRNIRGAFEVVAPLLGRDAAIVDDVLTTGNTVAEMARILRQAGAQRIEVWALARATRP
jgi:ComF family protein